MVGEPFEIEGLDATGAQPAQKLGLGGAGVAIDDDQGVVERGVVHRADDRTAIRAIAARDNLGTPADGGENAGHRLRALSAAPAIHERPPAAVLFGQWALKMAGHVARHHRRADLAGAKGAVLNVDGANRGTLGVVKGGEVDRPRQAVFGKLRWRTDVDDIVETMRQKVGQR